MRKWGGRREREDPHLPEGDEVHLVDPRRRRMEGGVKRKGGPSSSMGEKRLFKRMGF